MATSRSHKFNVSISVDVNDDDEYLIMRLCLGMSGVRKRAQKIVFLVTQMGYISPIGLKKARNRLLPNLLKDTQMCHSTLFILTDRIDLHVLV